MLEGFQCEASQSALTNFSKNCVAELVETNTEQPNGAVSDDQSNCACDHHYHRFFDDIGRHGVDGGFEEKRRCNR